MGYVIIINIKDMTTEVSFLIKHLPSKASPLIRPDFRCTEIVKYY
jgi:hypothetical protein